MTMQEHINRVCPKGLKPDYKKLAKVLDVSIETLRLWRFQSIRERKVKTVEAVTNFFEGGER